MSLIFQLIKFKESSFFTIQNYSSVLFLLSLWTISPLFADHINSSKKVSEYVLSIADAQTEIVIAHAPGKQPSLPFYLTQNDNKLHIEENITALLTYIKDKDNLIIVAQMEQFKTLVAIYPNIEHKVISTRIIDRKEIAEYYICVLP